MTNRTGSDVSFFAAAMTSRVSTGVWPVSMITSPSSVSTMLDVEFTSRADWT